MDQKELETVVNMLVSPNEDDAKLGYDILNNHGSLLIPKKLRSIIDYSDYFITNKYFRWSDKTGQSYIILDMGNYQAIRWLQGMRDGNKFEV